MAWIESHTVLLRHRKVLQLADDLHIPPVQVLGHLHALWHAALEQQEDGDLTEWPDAMIAQAAAYLGDASHFVTCLQARKWLDGKLIHDWVEYAGRYLESKYRTGNPAKLLKIQRKYQSVSRSVSSRTKVRPKSAHLPNQPNLTKPTIEESRKNRLATLESFVVSDAVREWARKSYQVEIPEHVLREFKDHWRGQPKLRTDWDATFRNRIAQLVGWKVLQPNMAGVLTSHRPTKVVL